MNTETYVLPSSFTQRRLWMLDQMDPGAVTYHIAWAVELTGPLDVTALETALTWLVERHETLRTHFTAVDGEPAQVVVPAAPTRLPVVDAGPGDAWRGLVSAAAREPFDLAAGPLTRFGLIRRPADAHVLTVVVHHAVADGWSFGVLFRELAAGYAAAVAGATPDLPPPPVQYADFAVWQREQDERGAFDADLDFWHAELAGAPTLLDLPADRPRPAEQTDTGGEVGFVVPDDLTARLRAARDGTLFTRLLAGFQMLLHRLTGADDLLVAVPVAGRTRPETRDVVGFFANTLALRARFTDRTDAADVLARARASATAAQDRQDVPFDRIVDRLAPTRSLAHAPVAQVMFALDEPPAAVTAAGLRIDPRLWENGAVKFDLTLTVEDRPDGLRGRITYRADLYDEPRIRRLADRYLTLLAAALDQPNVPVGELPLLDAVERDRLLRAGDGVDLPLPDVTGVGELLDRYPPADPDAVAVAGPDGTRTHRELADRARQLTGLLRAHGVGPDVPVGLCLDRGVDLVAAIVAVWRAGGGYLPLDPTLPAGRLATMLADAAVPVLLTDAAGAARAAEAVAGAGVAPVVLRLDQLDPADPPTEPSPPVGHPDALAYLLYTSGSTGTPKGVAVTHRAVVNLLLDGHRLLGLTPADRVAAITTPAFDISVVELALPLLAGARIELLDAETARDPAALRAACVDRGVTVLQATPASWRMLAATPGGVPAGIRSRISGGEALPRDLADALRADGARLLNGYGPSETTIYSSIGPVGAAGPVDLGRPVANTRIHLLDPAGRPVPEDVAGEIHIGGTGVARGYHGRPGLTADRFRPDPFGPPGSRRYATGDLARRLPDGRLDYLGRADQQVKVRGFRIELGEIEAALRDQPGIADAAVTTWGAGVDVRLAAYAVTDADPAQLWPDVRAALARRLPEYMLPATLVRVAALPRTAGGKLDRRALPEPTWRETTATGPTAPRGPVEEQLAALWRDVLGRPDIGAHDNFFALGGHSLTATRLIARIRATFGVDLPLRRLFGAPTVAGLAELLTVGAGPGPDGVERVGPADRIGPAAPTPQDLLASIDDLSDSEVDALLDTLIAEEGV
ncbi:amino acid adenylation domain-containing protein [Micromonospora sp. WMMD882]|uniref:amino acid adenylation domain-containing protein n=1 Tax=Micromonospora sp. WMMD882 TaxID=3015151 RepID=UPI00248BAE67|nr:amino acid adenylation domain-containing protein [Micromonospora sp. WMMD882]WBB80948.1 amino acid adenylation domain-containing protein [Micromonospora sp. WMMD882]